MASSSSLLDGSASSDPDGTIVSYEWREGSDVLAFGASPSVFLSVGTHTLTLEVRDDHGATGTDSVVVTVNRNEPPTANAGPDQTVTDVAGDGAEVVILNGSASSDANGTIVSYEWREGDRVIAAGASPSVALAVGTHALTLQVTDNDGATGTDSVVVTVKPNQPPTANAGPDQTVTDTGGDGAEVVILNGSASSDANGSISIAGYEWREGTNVIAVGVSPAVSLSVGTHTLTLQVTDNDGATGTDSVVVTVRPPAPAPTTAHIGDLDGSSAGNKSAWTARADGHRSQYGSPGRRRRGRDGHMERRCGRIGHLHDRRQRHMCRRLPQPSQERSRREVHGDWCHGERPGLLGRPESRPGRGQHRHRHLDRQTLGDRRHGLTIATP